MINPREAGFRVPQRIAGGSPKEGKVAERLARLSSLVDELRANGNFQDAVSEYLNGRSLIPNSIPNSIFSSELC